MSNNQKIERIEEIRKSMFELDQLVSKFIKELEHREPNTFLPSKEVLGRLDAIDHLRTMHNKVTDCKGHLSTIRAVLLTDDERAAYLQNEARKLVMKHLP